MCYKNIINHYKKNYPSEIELVSKVLQDRKHLPEFCVLAMKVDFKDQNSGSGHFNGKKTVNKMINTLINCGFIVRMFQGIQDKNVFYLTFEMTQKDIEKNAQEQEYEMKVLEHNVKFQYNIEQKKMFEPFRSKDICEIYISIIRKVIPL